MAEFVGGEGGNATTNGALETQEVVVDDTSGMTAVTSVSEVVSQRDTSDSCPSPLLGHVPANPDAREMGTALQLDGRSLLSAAVSAAAKAKEALRDSAELNEFASHEPIFQAYALLKSCEENPRQLDKWLEEAGIRYRSDTPLPKRILRLILTEAHYVEPKQTEHDWSDWIYVMDADKVPISLDAVIDYRTSFVQMENGLVKGHKRLKERLKQLRAPERSRRKEAKERRAAAEMERSAEKESATAGLVQRALTDPIGQIEAFAASEELFHGIGVLVFKDGMIGCVVDATENDIIAFVNAHGIRS